MFKKLMPLVLVAFLSACASTPQTGNADVQAKPCCEKCERCKSGECPCCKSGQCQCMKGASSAKADEECPMCAKAAREWQARQGVKKP